MRTEKIDFYFNPETIEAYKNASFNEIYNFIQLNCSYNDDNDFNALLVSFLKQLNVKYTVNKSTFITWYFSDSDDLYDLSEKIVSSLHKEDEVKVSIQQIFDNCDYIPSFIVNEKTNDITKDLLPNIEVILK